MTRTPLHLLLMLWLAAAVVAQASPLRFLHITDSHFPMQASADYLRALFARPDSREAAFCVHTGDITEFGGRRQAWPGYLALFDGIELPHFELLGNHDQTWDGLADRVRARFGAPYYRFERQGVVCFGLNSASTQDPRPSFGEEQLRWLEAELAALPARARLAIFVHHSLQSSEFATPYEVQRLCSLLAGRNVLAFFVGHGHKARAGRIAAFDQVMGGATFGGPQGHGDCTIAPERLRYVYHFADPQREPRVLLDKPLGGFKPFTLKLDVGRKRDRLRVRLVPGRGAPALADVRVHLDFADEPVAEGQPGQRLVVATDGLVPGAHVLTVAGGLAEGGEHWRLHEFEVEAPPTSPLQPVWRRRLPEALQGPLAVSGDVLACCSNGGVLRGLALATGVEAWRRDLEGPAPGGVAADPAGGFVAATLGGVVERVAANGEPCWQQQLGQPVAATPLVLGDQVVCVDLDGGAHVLDRATGRLLWQRTVAGYAIEKAPVALADGRVVFGAWDAHVHAIALADGEPCWSLPSRGARAVAARYYSPADCSPAVLDGRVFVADRKFELTVLDLDGAEQGGLSDVASVAAHPPSHAVYLRRTSGHVACLDSRTLELRWQQELPVGRTPTPVTTDGRFVYAIGERDGVLYQLAAADGGVLARHRVNAGLYPFCPVTLAGDLVITGGMDGRLCALRVSAR